MLCIYISLKYDILHILTIDAFGIRDSDSEITTSSTHTADDTPSSYIGLPILELLSDTPLTTNMNLEDCLWAMEEELMKHWVKANVIETFLQGTHSSCCIPFRTLSHKGNERIMT